MALALCVAALAAACGSEGQDAAPVRRRPPPVDLPAEPLPTEPQASPFPTPTPGRSIPLSRADWVTGLPPLIVSRGSDVTRHLQRRVTALGSVDGNADVAIAASAGTAIVERTFDGNKRSELLLLRRNRAPERIDTGRAQRISLMDVASIDGRREVLFTTFHAAADETTGYLYRQEPGGSRRTRLTEASGPEYEMTRASYGGGLIVTSAWSDLTESFQFFRPDGSEVKGRPNPTEKLPYGQPPYMSDAVLSGGGKSLAYLEGPDFDQLTQSQIGDWVVVVQDQTTGRELLRVNVADGGDVCVPWMDFDGRWVVVSRAKWTRGGDDYDVCSPTATKTLSIVALDTSAETLSLVEITGAIGVATIDD